MKYCTLDMIQVLYCSQEGWAITQTWTNMVHLERVRKTSCNLSDVQFRINGVKEELS